MPNVAFTSNLRRHLDCPDREVTAATVREALEQVFVETPKLRSYLLDDNGAVRPHVNIFVDGKLIEDKQQQSDGVSSKANIYVMQSISGG